VKQSTAGIFISQDKYVKDILNKFDFRSIKPASTPNEAHKSLGKDEEGEDVDVHLYRSMIGCLMYLTASRPDISHHFIRDCYDQRLINVVKVHTDDNVANLLTKGFDLARFNSLVVNIGMMNPYLHLRGGLLVKYGL
ncbi:hypothetical protein Tco_0171359, partial [Tanacetum coccineum]